MNRKRRLATALLTTIGLAVQAQAAPMPSTPSMVDTEPESHGVFAGMRPGSDISVPGSYPFLPAGRPIPTVPIRRDDPLPYGVNLAAHLPYRVTTQFPDDYWHAQEVGYPDVGQLTDGRLGSLAFTDRSWVGYQYQYLHHVDIDLRHPSLVRACSLDFLQNVGAGVVFPDEVTYYASQDGKHWARLGTITAPTTDAGKSIDYRPRSFAFELSGVRINARYLRAAFVNKIWAFMDEFAVYGSPGIDPAAHFPKPAAQTDRSVADYARSGAASEAGIHNMLLVYTHGHADLGTWTERDFEPVIAPVPRRGRRPLFDTLVFTPYRISSKASAWTGWLNDLYAPGKQLDALDAALDHAHRGWPRFAFPAPTEQVAITIPVLDDVASFGSWTPRGPNLCLNPAAIGAVKAEENRERVVDWYLNEVTRRWQKAHFRHLKLVAIVWQPESLSPVEPMEPRLIQHTARLVHGAGLSFVWIPFYGAIGIPRWKQLGFDLPIIQPNVSFHWSVDPLRRLQGADRLARNYGMGMEIEAHWDVTSAYRTLATEAQRRYFAYLAAGRTLGYQDDDVVKAWYLNSKTLLYAYRSPNPLYRRVYDCTWRFIEGRRESRSKDCRFAD